LRQRYAAGEIDADTFEHMWERLVASYRQVSDGVPGLDYNYQEKHWTGSGSTSTFPTTYGQGKGRRAELEQYRSETNM
jgi:hypothetical protein